MGQNPSVDILSASAGKTNEVKTVLRAKVGPSLHRWKLAILSLDVESGVFVARHAVLHCLKVEVQITELRPLLYI